MDWKRMLLIYNPKSGQAVFPQHLSEVLGKLTARGFLVTAYPTQKPRDAYRLSLELGGDCEYLVCAGGDGTFNEIVGALMQLEARPKLGYIPCGTANDFASSMGLSSDVLEAADIILEGKPVGIDIGSFQDKHFSYVAAFGLFTDVSYETPQNMKNLLGHTAYMLEGVKRLANIKSWDMTIVCDGETISGEFVLGMIANSTTIGGFHLPLDICKQGDGLFELILLKRISRFSQIPDIIGAITGAEAVSDRFIVRSAKSISIFCEGELSWALDGEFGGNHREANINVHRHALYVIGPGKNGLDEEKSFE